MRSSDSQFGLAFLLSFGALPIAGCAEDDDDGDPTGAESAPTSDATNATNDPTGDTDSADPSGGTDATDGSMDATDTATTDTGVDTGDTTEPGECGDIPIPPVCQDWSDRIAECNPEYADPSYAAYCACNIMQYGNYGAGCSQALEDYFACVAALSCEQFEDDVCVAEETAIDSECDFGDGTSSGG